MTRPNSIVNLYNIANSKVLNIIKINRKYQIEDSEKVKIPVYDSRIDSNADYTFVFIL